ncbi:MAG: class I SAM-dependent methyltransferase [Alphaproteobacteria bacterium]|nr:class I SAM-dependent methyltransferase [Alphaproteobacteria bacterium]
MTLTVRIHEAHPGPGTEVQYLVEGNFVNLACPVCGGKATSTLLAEVRAGDRTSIESAFCSACEHRYHRKMPSAAWIASYYARGWDEGNSTTWGLKRRLRERLKNSASIGPIYNRVRDFVKGEDSHFRYLRAALEGITEQRGSYLFPARGHNRVLEVGCGYGDKLLLFRRLGFAVMGQEASARRAETCRKLGLAVVERDVTDPSSELANERPFDLAFSTHVLEHVPDALAQLRAMALRVREGGHVMIEVPNLWQGEGLIRQSHGIMHCHTFSLRSLTTLMRKAGLTPIRAHVDINLVVIAEKNAKDAVHEKDTNPLFASSAAPEGLLAPFRGLSLGTSTKIEITYDPACTRVRRVDDGLLLRELRAPFATRDFSIQDRLIASLEADGTEPTFPVHFLYAGNAPPIWVKRQ